MCRYTVLHACPTGHHLGLSDNYGKYHLARIADGASARVGEVLHGVHAVPGLQFLVAASGQRLSARFESVRVSRQAMLDELQQHAPGARLLPVCLEAVAAEGLS